MGRNGAHQESWGVWMQLITKLVPDLADQTDLKAAFKRLGNKETVRLSKPFGDQRHGFDYSGYESDDDMFFFSDRFNVTITDDGRKYWDGFKVKTRTRTIGF
jgi:hypothetical protein